MITKNRILPRLLICVFLAAAFGCQSDQKYQVVVTNRTATPITIWLTKDHGPYGIGWEPPEIMADDARSQIPQESVIQPGETRGTSIKTQMDSDNTAVLRIYSATEMNKLLAIPFGDANRLDLDIEPGYSDMDIVRGKDGALTAKHHEKSTTQPATQP
jgi:hypothetical protein